MKSSMIILVCLFFTGCGTIFNLSRPAELKPGEIAMGSHPTMEYYGGVKTDLEADAIGLIDLPFSAIADTFTLPVVYFSKPDEQPNAAPTKAKPNSQNKERGGK